VKDHLTITTMNVMMEITRMVMAVTNHASLKKALSALEDLLALMISAKKFVAMV
jgi:hypothetical protein